MQLKGNIIIPVGKGWWWWGGRWQRDREREGEKEEERERRWRRSGREGTEEVEDRAHFSGVLSNGTSSISPKRSLQSTKLLISNERPWNTVAKQLGGGGAYWAADSCRSVSIITIFPSPHRLPCWWTAAASAHWPQPEKNGLLRLGKAANYTAAHTATLIPTQHGETAPKQLLLCGCWMCLCVSGWQGEGPVGRVKYP